MLQRIGCYDHRRHNLLRFLRCAAYGLLEVLLGQTDYKISRSQRTPLPLNLPHMSSDIEDSGGVDTFAVQREDIVWQAYKQGFKGQWKRGRPLKRWSDPIRNDT